MTQTLMNKATAVLTMVAVLAAASCSNDEVMEESAIADVVETYNNPHTIPEEEALANLQSFMNEGENNETRGYMGERKVAQIYSVEYHPNTRSDAQVDCEKMVYVANFENEQGFAILAADDRIPDKVIAITEKGVLNKTDMDDVIMDFAGERPVFADYPLVGPGFYIDDEYPDEISVNPNTVDLFIPEEGDTLIGEFEFDEGDSIIDVTGKRIFASEYFEKPQRQVGTIVLEYAFNSIEQARNVQAESDDSITRANVDRDVYTSSWVMKNQVYPMLGWCKSWRQNKPPFNDWCPKKGIFKKWKKKTSAGCFPLSIAKVLTHHEFPATYTYKGYTVNWTNLKNNLMSQDGSKSAACLLRGIGDGCDSWYTRKGTFTFPYKAVSYMKRLGYKNVSKKGYKNSLVLSMLNNGLPVIVYAYPKRHPFKAHCWNIDGYSIKSRTITTRTYVDNVLTNTTTKEESCDMVHCDWGWGGKCNGYFVSGVFDMGSSDVIFDNYIYEGASNYNYKRFLHIIKYSR